MNESACTLKIIGNVSPNGLIMLLCCECNTFVSLIFSCHTDILEEEIIDEVSVKDLSQREADAPIFSKLHLSYGKAVTFKEEFGRKGPKKRSCSPSAVKPTMADICICQSKFLRSCGNILCNFKSGHPHLK